MESEQSTPRAAASGSDADTTPRASPSSSSSSSSVNQTMVLILSDDSFSKIQAAKQIRRLTKTSQRYRRQFSDAVSPLVDMLRSESREYNEAALLALVNLAVKDETNKISIVGAGALVPIIGFLRSGNSNLQEHATASLLTLSAASFNKPIISASGAVPLLVEILRHGSPQTKVDAVMALYNLSTHSDNLSLILKAGSIPSIISLLKTCRKSSKTAEKCIALIESLVDFDEGRTALISEEGGVLAVVEMLESGSLPSREHAVGALLTMCQSDRSKYREPILREGVIPGLLELTVQGTPKSQSKAKMLLCLLRENVFPRSEHQPDTLENIVCSIISQIDGEKPTGKAKQMLSEMVQVSMEQSLRHLQQRALVCTQADLPLTSGSSKVSSN